MSGPDRSDPTSYNFPQGKLLRPEQIDNLGRALFSLLREVCVLNDRQIVLEHVLAQKGIDVTQAVDDFQPDEAMQAHLDARTQMIISTIVRDLAGDE